MNQLRLENTSNFTGPNKLLKTGCNNVFMATLFLVVNNFE